MWCALRADLHRRKWRHESGQLHPPRPGLWRLVALLRLSYRHEVSAQDPATGRADRGLRHEPIHRIPLADCDQGREGGGMSKSEFGDRLRKAIKYHGYTQADVCRLT